MMRAMLNYYEGDVVEFGSTAQLGSMNGLREAGPQRLPFLDFIPTCQNFHTTDPRDKVYALIGLAKDCEKLSLTPDYTESPQVLFTKATRAVCRASQSLDLLMLDMDPKRRGLPSWAKDFSSSFEPYLSAGGVFLPLTDFRYAASGGSPPFPRRSGTDSQH
ncbi:hypothetical protein LTR65_006569 [Meristemomyces frigidus]